VLSVCLVCAEYVLSVCLVRAECVLSVCMCVCVCLCGRWQQRACACRIAGQPGLEEVKAAHDMGL
jgi:hypothetical protein